MNPPAQFSHLRLWLYLGANCLPPVLQWLILNFDTSPRGILILCTSSLITICVTTRAYLDGKTTDKVVSETVRTEPSNTPVRTGVTETTIAAPARPIIPAPPIK